MHIPFFQVDRYLIFFVNLHEMAVVLVELNSKQKENEIVQEIMKLMEQNVIRKSVRVDGE